MSETTNKITDEIFRQIMEIRDSGTVNMLDIVAVQKIAYERDFFELVCYIEDNRKEYSMFILNGKRKQ